MTKTQQHTKAQKPLVPELRFREFEGEWNTKLIGDTCSVKTGGRDTQDRIDDGMYPFFVRSNTVERINTYSFDGEAILTSGDGVGVGKNFHYINGKFDYHQRVYALRDFRDEFSGKFIYQVFVEKFYKRVIRLSAKNSVDSVRMNMITDMKVHFPSLPEQQKIASFLSAVDEKIQQLINKKALLEQYKKGVMQQLFSGHLRFKDENGNDYPDWEEKRLGEVCTNISYGMNAAAKAFDGVNKYLRITDIDELSNRLNSEKLTSPNGTLEDKFRVKERDLLFARTGASVGKSYMYNSKDGTLYFAGFLIRFNVKIGDPVFIYLQTQTIQYNKWVKVMSMRSGQPGINAEEYKSFRITFPCLEEQKKIAAHLTGIDEKIRLVAEALEATRTFKKGLLQKMFV